MQNADPYSPDSSSGDTLALCIPMHLAIIADTHWRCVIWFPIGGYHVSAILFCCPTKRRRPGMRKALPKMTESAHELQQRMKSEPDLKKRQRFHALYLAASGQARHRQEIAALLGVHRHSVAVWFAAYAEG